MSAAEVASAVTTRAAARPSPPLPDECTHPGPVLGFMAHEFSPYRKAAGPEGLRRTTMYYGPIVGGLPISAWHCETCGLLKLDYPDGRKEERRLFPGPQPGLIAVAVAEAVAPEAVLGRQARVSGLSVPARVYRELAPEPERVPFVLPPIPVPATLGALINVTVVAALGLTAVLLVVISIGAVYDYRTASWVGPLAGVAAAIFGGAVLLKIAEATFTHFVPWPRLAPSPAHVLRGRPQMDAVSRTVTALLTLITAGLALLGILSVYSWRTPDGVKPIAYLLALAFVVGTVVIIAGATARHLASGRHPRPVADPD